MHEHSQGTKEARVLLMMALHRSRVSANSQISFIKIYIKAADIQYNFALFRFPINPILLINLTF
jgi:hypothetical protein